MVWDTVPVLQPALDYRDGIVYITIPAQRRVTKLQGKGKEKTEVEDLEVQTTCITSQHERFWFDRETVQKRGFRWPGTFVQQVDDSRWPMAHLRKFLRKELDPPDPSDLFHEIRSVYETYVEFSDDRLYDLMSLYVMATYVFRGFSAMAYIYFNGTKGSGKSRNIKILEAIAFNTVYSANSTPSSLFRQVAGCPGTICIDEAERFESEDALTLRSILNAGYTDGAKVQRSDKRADETWVNTQYAAFSPKVLASIHPIDSVMQDRSILVTMIPALRHVPEFNDKDPQWPKIRADLYLWAMYYLPQVQAVNERWQAKTRYERTPNLQNRPWQLAQTYLVLADIVGGDTLVETMAGFFAEYYAAQQAEQDATDRVRLVLRVLPSVLKQNIPQDGGYYPIKVIHDAVAEFLDDDQKDPKRFTTRSTGRHLETIGFRDKRSRRDGLQYKLLADDVRMSFRKRRVEPMDEDTLWLEQSGEANLPEAPQPPAPQPAFGWEQEYADMADAD